MSTFLITNEWLVKHRTEGGGYNKKQLGALGVDWPPRLGWKDTLVGKHIDIKKAQEFEVSAKKPLTPSIMSFMAVKEWTDEETLKLLLAIQKKKPFDVIAKDHGCSVDDIYNQRRQIASDYWFNDKRPIEEIQKYTGLTLAEITDVIQRESAKEEPQMAEKFVPDYYVYTDGSCSDNGSKHAKAGMGIYFGKGDPRTVSQRVEGKQSNNTAELGAIIMVYKIIEADIAAGKKVMIASDSTYAIRAATTYGESCAKGGWKKDIPNKDMVKEAYELYKGVPNVHFMHVLGHTEKQDVHSIGNDGADKLANQAIGLEVCPYANVVEKVYLNVPFAKKDEAKKMGARWDAERKKWYVNTNTKNKDILMEMFKN